MTCQVHARFTCSHPGKRLQGSAAFRSISIVFKALPELLDFALHFLSRERDVELEAFAAAYMPQAIFGRNWPFTKDRICS